MLKQLSLALAGACLFFAGAPHVAHAAEPAYYVSLGDSAAAGYQPPGWTGVGYADQLAIRMRTRYPTLQLVKLGCPGETSQTLITGVDSPCRYGAGSQLNEAKKVLRAHPNQIALITINIGVNDILDACLDPESLAIDAACATSELPGALNNLATILRTLRQLAPGAPIAGMSYWDPFLGLWVSGPEGENLARQDHQSMRALNAGLVATYRRGGAVVADVAGPAFFDTENFASQTGTRWGVVPMNVANACRWTWFCVRPPLGPDPHPTTQGYGVIADAFAAVLSA
jgi:lysophospholipase L1-like esterase